MDLLSHMHVFVDIADQGSLAGAARRRGMAPSAVTASLKRLEARVGAQLILRSTRQLILTPEGERFLAQSREIIERTTEAIDQLVPGGPLTGTIRITSINDFGRARVAPLLDGFLKDHPGVRIELHLDDHVTDLIAGGFDIALRTGPLTDSALIARLLMRSGRSIAAAPAYWQAHGKPAHPDDLIHHNCLVLSHLGVSQRWTFQNGGKTFSVPVRGDRAANDAGLLRQWAIDGGGIVMKTDYDIEADIAAGRLETALDDFHNDGINLYAVHVAGRHLPRRVEAFLDYLSRML